MSSTIQQQNDHNFNATDMHNKKRILYVIILTAITMVLEISAGIITGSMALLANGWHMGTHFFALGIAYFTYIIARRFTDTKTFTFGTGKFGNLSAFTSSLFLGISATHMIYESIMRFSEPENISYNEAIIISCIALIVNIASVIMLRETGHNHMYHKHETHKHETHKHDQNIRAVYIHVIADVLTTSLAIIALILGKFLGWSFLDAVMGIIGGMLILKWSYGLLLNSGLVLLDGTKNKSIYESVHKAIESDANSIINDLHIWPLSESAYAAVITISSKNKHTPTEYRERLASIKELKHITIEIHYENTNAI